MYTHKYIYTNIHISTHSPYCVPPPHLPQHCCTRSSRRARRRGSPFLTSRRTGGTADPSRRVRGRRGRSSCPRIWGLFGVLSLCRCQAGPALLGGSHRLPWRLLQAHPIRYRLLTREGSAGVSLCFPPRGFAAPCTPRGFPGIFSRRRSGGNPARPL